MNAINPFIKPGGGGGGKSGLAELQAHIAKLNNYRWVVNSGKLYFLASRSLADGTIEHFVDRHP